jgi:hypothetical protein
MDGASSSLPPDVQAARSLIWPDAARMLMSSGPKGGELAMPSTNYHLFEQAMRMRKQILCMYDGFPRELCPIILGHSQDQEKALTYQFGGQSRSAAARRVALPVLVEDQQPPAP